MRSPKLRESGARLTNDAPTLATPDGRVSRNGSMTSSEPLTPSSETPWNALVVYPGSHSSVACGINARAHQRQPGSLSFEYVLRAEMSALRVPPTRAPERADDLWRHTCFEAFIAVTGAPGYYELNFSPSRQWAIYRFNAYRDRMSPLGVSTPPDLAVRRFDDRLELDATIALSDLRPQARHTLKLALTAVVEDGSGTLSYWALKHAPGKPDFHHCDGFVLEFST
jgi:hypothetical protein